MVAAIACHSMDFMANYFARGLFATGWENLSWFVTVLAINRVFPGFRRNELLQTCILHFVFRFRRFMSLFLLLLCSLFSVFHFQLIFAVMSIVYSTAKPFTAIIKQNTKRNVEHFRTVLFQWDHNTI